MSEVPTVTVVTPSSNIFRIRLLDGDIPINLKDITEVGLFFDDGLTVTSDAYPDVFIWKEGHGFDIAIGVIIFRLGTVLLGLSGVKNAALYTFEQNQTNSIFWGHLRIRVVARDNVPGANAL